MCVVAKVATAFELAKNEYRNIEQKKEKSGGVMFMIILCVM